MECVPRSLHPGERSGSKYYGNRSAHARSSVRPRGERGRLPRRLVVLKAFAGTRRVVKQIAGAFAERDPGDLHILHVVLETEDAGRGVDGCVLHRHPGAAKSAPAAERDVVLDKTQFSTVAHLLFEVQSGAVGDLAVAPAFE